MPQGHGAPGDLALVQKYGLGLRVIILLERILGRLRVGSFHKHGRRIYIEVTLTTA